MIPKRKKYEDIIFTLYLTGLGEIKAERLKLIYFNAIFKGWTYRVTQSFYYDPYDDENKVKEIKYCYGDTGIISEYDNLILFELNKKNKEYRKIVKVFSEYDERVKK